MIGKAEKQFRELEQIFKKYPEGLNETLNEFSKTGYHKRKDLLSKYRTTVLEKTGQLDVETKKLEEQAKSAIEKARSQNIISSQTQKSFTEYALNKNNFLDPQTSKFSIQKYQDFVVKLTSDTPIFDRENRNLKAYAVRRENFISTLDRYRQKIQTSIPMNTPKKSINMTQKATPNAKTFTSN